MSEKEKEACDSARAWCRGAWESSGEVKDQLSKQRQMMADGDLRGFWKKQGRFRLKKWVPYCLMQ